MRDGCSGTCLKFTERSDERILLRDCIRRVPEAEDARQDRRYSSCPVRSLQQDIHCSAPPAIPTNRRFGRAGSFQMVSICAVYRLWLAATSLMRSRIPMVSLVRRFDRLSADQQIEFQILSDRDRPSG